MYFQDSFRRHVTRFIVLLSLGVILFCKSQADTLSRLKSNPNNVSLINGLSTKFSQSKDYNERYRIGAIYVLGSIAYGSVEDGMNVRARMLQADPDNEYTRKLNNDNLFELCVACEGGSGDILCDKCIGRKACDVCNGSGVSKIAGFDGRPRKCLTCNGTGKCSGCNGAGKVITRCKVCKGLQRVVSKDKARQMYFGLLEGTDHISDGNKLIEYMPNQQIPTHNLKTDGSVGVPLDTALTSIVLPIVDRSKNGDFKKLTILDLYFNGDSSASIAKFFQRRIVGELLKYADDELEIMERKDIKLHVDEDMLQWMIDGSHLPEFNRSQAVLTGEVLWSKGFEQLLLSLRLIDTNTGELLAAPCSIIELVPELCQRLNVPESVSDGAQLYHTVPNISKSAADFAKKLAGKKENISLLVSDIIPENYRFAQRVFTALLIDYCVAQSLPLLERDFLFLIAREQDAAYTDVSSLLAGKIILQIELDESSPIDSPVFFVKAVQRDGGRILSQAEFKLEKGKSHQMVVGSPKMGQHGADESLRAALADYRKAVDVDSTESLIFTETIRLSSDLKVSDEVIELFQSLANFSFPGYPGYSNQFRHREGYDRRYYNKDSIRGGQFPSEPILEGFLESYLKNSSEADRGSIRILKAHLFSIISAGFEINNANHNSRVADPFYSDGPTQIYPGPLAVIAVRIAQKYTVNSNLTPSLGYWNNIIFGGLNQPYYEIWRDDSFAVQLFRSLSGKSDGHKPIDPYKGQAICESRRTQAIFNYSVNTIWTGKFPSEITITIDLSPMRDKLKRVQLP